MNTGNLNQLSDFAGWVNDELKKRSNRNTKGRISSAIRLFLTGRGRLVREADGDKPYLIDDDGAALPLEKDGLALQAALSRAGLNASEAAFAWLLADLRAGAFNDGRALRLARWTRSTDTTVRVSAGPRAFVEATPGRDPLLLSNGANDTVFAADASLPVWTPTTPTLLSQVRALAPNAIAPADVPNYTPKVQAALLAAWITALVAGIRPLPILALLGGRGSGKSWCARAIMRLFLGPDGNVAPLSPDSRDFLALAVRRPVLAIDNLDSFGGNLSWLQDTLAAVGSGGRVQGRAFYTRSDVSDERLQAAVILTSRTAAFARADVAERTLPIFTSGLADVERVADSDLENELDTLRAGLLTFLTGKAADVLALVAQAPADLPVRFLDFGRFVWAYLASIGQEGLAIPALLALRKAQSIAVGDANPLLSAILEYGPEVLTANPLGLFNRTPAELVDALSHAGADIPYLGGGKAIARELRELKPILTSVGWQLSEGKQGNNTLFSLRKVP